MARKRPNGDGTIRQRPDGRWEGRYSAGRDPGTGKLIRKSIYGKTEKEVSQKLRKIGVEIEDGTYQEPSKMTVAAWLDVWMAEYNNHTAAASVKTYNSHIKNHIKPGLGALKLQKLSIPDVQRFCNDLCQRKEKPLASKTVNVIHGVLHKALDQAAELGYIRVNPSDRTKLPRIVKPEIKPLDDNDIKSLLAAIEENRFRNIFITALFTGMRESEVVGLTWDCVDYEQGTIRVYRQLQKVENEYTFVPLKNNKPRLVTPAALVLSTIQDQQLHQKKQRLKAGSAWDNSRNLIFTDESGRYITGNAVYKEYKKLATALGFPKSRFHDLRHTYAVNALRSGDDIKTVQENLGHHTAAFTLDTYAHVTDQMKRDSANRMQAYIDNLNVK